MVAVGAGFVDIRRRKNGSKQKKDKTAPHGGGHYVKPDCGEGGVLARAAQQRKQLGAQRQARGERASDGKKQCGNDERRSHGKDYKGFISGAQQISIAAASVFGQQLHTQPSSELRFFPFRQINAAMT